MDLSVILTYRCDSRCSMCYIWKNPTKPSAEVTLETLEKLPGDRFDYLNVTGGEPTLRKDLAEVVDILYPKAMTLEISTNGLHVDKLLPIVKKYPNVKVRISVEGFEATNDRIRGEQGGFDKKIDAMEKLIAAGGTDLGFATTFQDENITEVVDMYRLTKKLGIEFATSALHNGFQFHKNDNFQYDRMAVARRVEDLIAEMLKSSSVKSWFRAYLNLGLIEKILGHDRLIPCTAGTDFHFIDPWSDVYACNVRPDLIMGNLKEQSWEEIWNGPKAKEQRTKVAQCTQNCWMVASAKTAMRNPHFAKLPKFGPMMWVVQNKLRATFGMSIPFDRYIDYGKVQTDDQVVQRVSFLEQREKGEKVAQPEVSRRYSQFKSGFFNR
jgi:MoaA/NifB/PqqE/SkfB family radical SAM enzyme